MARRNQDGFGHKTARRRNLAPSKNRHAEQKAIKRQRSPQQTTRLFAATSASLTCTLPVLFAYLSFRTRFLSRAHTRRTFVDTSWRGCNKRMKAERTGIHSTFVLRRWLESNGVLA